MNHCNQSNISTTKNTREKQKKFKTEAMITEYDERKILAFDVVKI